MHDNHRFPWYDEADEFVATQIHVATMHPGAEAGAGPAIVVSAVLVPHVLSDSKNCLGGHFHKQHMIANMWHSCRHTLSGTYDDNS